MTANKTSTSDNLPYRPCVGILLLNKHGQVFVGQRMKNGTPEGWQMPQGGIDEGEDAATAALRELYEEVGTDKVEILEESKDWFTYDLPDAAKGNVWKGRFRGQTQKWFAMRFIGNDSDINLNHHHKPEFSDFKWVNIEELPDLIIPFKRKVYEQVVAAFRHLAAPVKVD